MKVGRFVDILPIILFFLGVVFIILGWRWQNPPNEEAVTALKGLAYLKREIVRVQDQVYDLEGKLIESKEKEIKEAKLREAILKEKEAKLLEKLQDELKSIQAQSEEKKNANVIFMSEKVKSTEVEPNPHLSPKYQEVLQLAANGQRIPEIAQRLYLSQDAVRMVLRMQPNGGKRS